MVPSHHHHTHFRHADFRRCPIPRFLDFPLCGRLWGKSVPPLRVKMMPSSTVFWSQGRGIHAASYLIRRAIRIVCLLQMEIHVAVSRGICKRCCVHLVLPLNHQPRISIAENPTGPCMFPAIYRARRTNLAAVQSLWEPRLIRGIEKRRILADCGENNKDGTTLTSSFLPESSIGDME